jgi:hypothetical protein
LGEDSLCCALSVGEGCWWTDWAADGGGGGGRGELKESTALETPLTGGAGFRDGTDEVVFSFGLERGESAGVFWGVCPFVWTVLLKESGVVCEDVEGEVS